MALLLGMESSCDETSAAVVEEQNGVLTVRSNIVASQIETHRLYGGVVPEIASRAHVEAVTKVTADALAEAGIKLTDLDAVAVTSHPGLIGALLVGVNFAKSLAYANRIPLVSVNHIHAHICAAFLTHPDLKPPFLALVVSGGHTCFYDVNEKMEYREIGGTRDDAAGEAFDKIGRVIAALGGEEIALSFSGIKTAALNYLNSAEQKGEAVNRADLAASYTAKIVEAIVKKTDLALKQTGLKTLVLAGGVAANSHLRGALETLCKKRGVRLAMPSVALCGDNGAMVAAAGYFGYRAGCFSDTALNASALDYPEGVIGKTKSP